MAFPQEIWQLVAKELASTDANDNPGIRYLSIADNDTNWFDSNDFHGWDDIVSQLVGIDEDGNKCLRVSLSATDSNADLYTYPVNMTVEQLALTCIGEGTDNLPVLRLLLATP